MNDINIKEKETGFRMLDPIKIAWTGLNHFINVYGVKEKATYKERLERLELLSKDKNTPKSDKEQINSILKTLGKIATCDLCHKEIIWDKQKGVSNPLTETARHLDCHKKTEEIKENYGNK